MMGAVVLLPVVVGVCCVFVSLVCSEMAEYRVQPIRRDSWLWLAQWALRAGMVFFVIALVMMVIVMLGQILWVERMFPCDPLTPH